MSQMIKENRDDFSIVEFVIARKAEDDFKYHILNKILESISNERDIVDKLTEDIVGTAILKVYKREIDKLIDR